MTALWLFPGFGSVVRAETAAVFTTVDPHCWPAGTMKATRNARLWPLFNPKLLHSTLLPFRTHEGSDPAAENVSPDGTGSERTTLCAASGPRFVPVSVYTMVCPGWTVSGPFLMIMRSARGTGHVTVVLTIALWLFPGFGSVADVETDAWFTMVALHPAVGGTSNATVNCRLCPFVRLKLLHSTLPPFRTHEGSDAPALNVSPAGIGSVTTTFPAVSGPLFAARNVYVTVPPLITLAGPVFVTVTSAWGRGQFTVVL